MTAIARLLPPALGALAAAVAGGALLHLLTTVGPKQQVVLLAAIAAAVLLVLSRRPKEVLLFTTILALTYNRQYFSFAWATGESGQQGIFWIPADLPMLALFGVSLLQAALSRSGRPPGPQHRPGVGAALPALPFLAAAALATAASANPHWAVAELLRVAKFALLLWWLERNLAPSLWWSAVAAFAAAALAQSALGVLQVLMRSDGGMLAFLGLGSTPEHLQNLIENRARGTLGHPNFFAPWLLFVVPAALGAALFARMPPLRLAGLAVALAGVAGIVASKSRGPAALAVLGLALMVALAVQLRAMSARRAVGLGLAGLLALGATGLALREAIVERLTGDFAASVEFRQVYNEAALELWADRPVLGIGPNHMIREIPHHVPVMLKLDMDLLAAFQGEVAVRAAAPVHNLYLLVLAETGLVGFVAFGVLLAAILARAFGATMASRGAVRGICAGLGVGVLLQVAQQMIDFSLWWDPSWYSLAIIAGLLARPPEGVA